MAVHLVVLDVGVGGAAASDARPGVLTNVVVRNVGRGVVNQNAVCILDDLIFDNPGVPTLNRKNTFRPRLVNFVVYNHRVASFRAAVSNVSFKVLGQIVFLDVGIGRLNQQNALCEV